jgi:hypothetical protein
VRNIQQIILLRLFTWLASLLVRIREIVKDEKYDDEHFKEKVLTNATDEFKAFIEKED